MILYDTKNDSKRLYHCICGKIYNHRSNYYRHKKKCNYDTSKPESSDTKNMVEYKEKEDINYKDVIIKLIKENTTLQDMLIKQQEELKKEQKEFMNKYENLVLHIKPNMNNCHNTINKNKTYNILMYLNDKCKDAMTIQEFAEKLVVSIDDLEKKKYDCLSNVIVKNLKSLRITDRPVHCANIKKKEWYLHDKIKGWEKDNGNKLIKNAEYGINKKYNAEFNKNYPDYCSVDNLRDKYMRLVSKIFSDLPEKENSRLLNELAKHFTLDEDIM
jgi:hypothetical protein